MSAVRTRRLELMRPAEIVAARAACPVAYLPVGPLEWHGPHLPLGVDPLVAHAVALGAAALVGGLVMPPLYLGTDVVRSPEMLRSIGFEGHEHIVGMDFPGNSVRSLYADADVFERTVRHYVELLARQEYRIIAIVNGHGGENQIPALRALEEMQVAPARVLYCQAWLDPEGLPEGQSGGGHADATETSLMMHLSPESVDLSALPPLPHPLRNVDWAIVDGPTFEGRPNETRTVEADPRRLSSSEAGEADLWAAAEHVAERVRRALAEAEGR